MELHVNLIFLNLQNLEHEEISLHKASEELVNITSIYAPEFTEDDVILTMLILETIVEDNGQLNKASQTKNSMFACMTGVREGFVHSCQASKPQKNHAIRAVLFIIIWLFKILYSDWLTSGP